MNWFRSLLSRLFDPPSLVQRQLKREADQLDDLLYNQEAEWPILPAWNRRDIWSWQSAFPMNFGSWSAPDVPSWQQLQRVFKGQPGTWYVWLVKSVYPRPHPYRVCVACELPSTASRPDNRLALWSVVRHKHSLPPPSHEVVLQTVTKAVSHLTALEDFQP